jgi:hypothetical protein
MNPLSDRVITGTTGELLIQLRLFQYGVQAAPPLMDSGNDLIAVRGGTFRAIQVKTTGNPNGAWNPPATDRAYHILALVRLIGEDEQLWLDQCEVYLLDKEIVDTYGVNPPGMEQYQLSQERVNELIPHTAA